MSKMWSVQISIVFYHINCEHYNKDLFCPYLYY